MRRTLPLLLLALAACEAPDTAPDPGEFVLHRLNRAEYNNTVRDLFGTSLTPADDFPADDFGFGYDHISAVLSLSPLHIELYERAADQLLREAFAPPVVYPLDLVAEAEDGLASQATAGFDFGAGFWSLNAQGSIAATLEVPEAGTYVAGARAYGQLAGDEPARMALYVDDVLVDRFEVTSVASDAERYGAELTLGEGPHEVRVAFLNDYEAPATGADRNLMVDHLFLSGPLGVPSPESDRRSRVQPCSTEEMGARTCAALSIHTFAERAWRRPVSSTELEALLSIYDLVIDGGDGFDFALQQGLKAVLMSPHFLFRIERDESTSSTEPHPVTQFELAARLSYFLWSSTPDDVLLGAARAGDLSSDEQIAGQVRRMLADAKSQALVDNFAGQWLYIRAVDDAAPDGATWPDFDEELRTSLKGEMSAFFLTFLEEDRSMVELLTARESFVDARLAEHYGLEGFEPPADGGFARVAFSGSQRGGVLTQAGMLASTSYPLRTSPTRRGKWIMEQLLCSAPPPPPPGVEGLEEGGEGPVPETVREQLEAHVSDPTCASCHVRMDAYGFALEHYDAVGVWREDDRGQPIDATAAVDGVPFDGGLELAQVLADDRSLTRCMGQQLYTYALARGPQTSDWPLLNRIHGEFEEGGFRLTALVEAIALSPAFRNRRGGQELVEADAPREGEE
ncbi:MAG: DUF1592 domain-containing protein [Deltaproteobacteria bacterium]|nr:DUF1592 domain-containing protein [Deltaproteobacteria bacterium]